jgi:hypothetical protein
MQQAQHRIDMMKGAEYVKYTQDYNRMKYGYSGDQLDPLVLLNPSERANYQNGSELDWQDIMFRNALTTSHQISISGGNLYGINLSLKRRWRYGKHRFKTY